jgi:hypothetical protein
VPAILSARAEVEREHAPSVGASVVYFAHTVPTSKPINLGKAAKHLLDSELAVSAAWPSDAAARTSPSLEKAERLVAQLTQCKMWSESVTGWGSLLTETALHPVTALRVLRLVRQRAGAAAADSSTTGTDDTQSADDTDALSFDELIVEAEKALLQSQVVTLAEQNIDARLFWSEREGRDSYVRLFLRTTSHTIQIGDRTESVVFEPRVMLHRDGIVQVSIGLHLPQGCTPAEVIDASSPSAPLLTTSHVPEPYATRHGRWVGGEWAQDPERGVRVRVIEHEPSSIADWLEMVITRILFGIRGFQGGVSLTYPTIIVEAGDCCTAWADNHQGTIAQLSARAVPHDTHDAIRVQPGPDLSAHTATRIHADAGSALILHLHGWNPSIDDLHHTLLYERIILVFMRLRTLERRISDFPTSRRDVSRSYRATLELEAEARGTFHRTGTARDISRHVLDALGSPGVLETIRIGASMLGERATTRASLRAARAANRFAILGLLVAVFAAIPAIPAILDLIEEQRAAHPDAGMWSVIQALAMSPLLLSALILGAAATYGLILLGTFAFRVVRYLVRLRKRGYVSRIEGYEITLADPADGQV